MTWDDDAEWLVSQPIVLPMLGGEERTVIVDGYEDDDRPEDFHTAIAHFLAATPAALHAAEHEIYRYYLDMAGFYNDLPLKIGSPGDVWKHIQLDLQPAVSRRSSGDKAIYVSLSCQCDWEIEHGLVLVLRNGTTVCRVGMYSDHLTTSDAYGRPELENVIYPGLKHDEPG
ncbi:MAG TPA: hypothetical protein VK539_25480 [Myxococcaceae bacterium]|nr:hypothetical protein [Myxococcaceae bacterium]